jgi:cyclic peptide transporter
VVLANSNSNYTAVIGNKVMKLLNGERVGKLFDPGDGNDRAYTVVGAIVNIYVLIVLFLLGRMVRGVRKRQRTYQRISRRQAGRFLLSLLAIVPFLYSLYILPKALTGFNWESTFVWSPVSFQYLALSLLTAIGITYVYSFVNMFFPEKSTINKKLPRILLMSILSGLSNMIVIVLVTSALDSNMRLRHIILYFVLAAVVYLLGRRSVQISLIRVTRNTIFDLRVELLNKIFLTTYQKFEKIDRGRTYTALNDDVETIGSSADQFISLITNTFTVLGAFLYLTSIDFWTALLVILLIGIISPICYFASGSISRYFEKARDTRNSFICLVNGMIDGFKEISLHKIKRTQYKADIIHNADEYRKKVSIAHIRFVNAFLVGESLLVLLLGLIAFALPRIFDTLAPNTVLNFIIVVLYLVGPINGILNAVPAIMQLKIAWQRIHQFLREIPANLSLEQLSASAADKVLHVDSLIVNGVVFQYPDKKLVNAYRVGPVDLEVRRGEIVFIVGENGSGKTTLAKLLTGLYAPEKGEILINGKPVGGGVLSEYFSAVFNPVFLFEKLYGIDMNGRLDEVDGYLKILGLDAKVKVIENKYSTIDLSGGQRKRLALLQCYLENAPIYLFDEWAADQDPEYRSFFYRILLPEMKRAGKIVIAITHDDHYFDVADKVVKMEYGMAHIYTSKHLQL